MHPRRECQPLTMLRNFYVEANKRASDLELMDGPAPRTDDKCGSSHEGLLGIAPAHGSRSQDFIGGVPIEILYDCMETAVTETDQDGHIVYNRSRLAFWHRQVPSGNGTDGRG